MLAALAFSASASASAVSIRVDVSATGFYAAYGADNPAPFQSLSQSFTLTFDPSLNYSEDTSNIVVNSLGGFPIGSKIGFNYQGKNPPGVIGSTLFIGGEALGVQAYSAGYVDEVFGITFLDFPTPEFAGGNFDYVDDVGSSVFQSTGFTATVTLVPEPATVFLMLSGTGLMGVIARRRRR